MSFTTTAAAASALLLLIPAAASVALSHDLGGAQSQYARLSPPLADRLRRLDSARSAAAVRGFEAASKASAGKRKAILAQFNLDAPGLESFEQIYVEKTLWPAGHRFRVCFFDGTVAARRQVLDLFQAIIEETSLKIDRTDRNCPDTRADIQIRFAERDCFSYYGQDALQVIKEDANLATMGLCNLSGPTWSRRDDGTIRHEIMHALGAAHEHQHPDARCKNEFDMNAFRNPPLFDPDLDKNEEAIKVNISVITKSYSRQQLKIIKYDPKSVMHYRLPATFFKNPKKATCALARENNDLSPSDWSFLRTMYPKR